MAARYFVGNGTNWSSTASWSTTDGGASGASVPTAADDVYFTALSPGNCVMDVAATMLSLNCTGFTKAITNSVVLTHTVLGSPFTLVPGMTWTMASGTIWVFNQASGTVLLTSGGKPVQTYLGQTGTSTATFRLMDSYGGSSITHTSGTLDFNNLNHSFTNISSSNSNVRTLLLGSSTITLTGTATNFDMTVSTNATVNAGTSTILNTGTGSIRAQVQTAVTLNNVVFSGTSGALFYISANNVTVQSPCVVFNVTEVTINTLLTVTGSNTARVYISTGHGYDTRSILTAAAVSLSYVDFAVIAGAGAAAPFTGTSLGDCGNNTGITFTPAVTRYWVATAGGNSNATTSWAASSGGASGASIPLAQDTVVFDANSITATGKTITLGSRTGSLDFSNVLNAPSVTFSSIIFGSVDLTGLSSCTGALNLYGALGSYTLKTNGLTTNSIVINASGGTYTFVDTATPTGLNLGTTTFTLTCGTFTFTGSPVVTCGKFAITGTVTRTMNLAGAQITCSATGTGVWDATTTTLLTFNAGTSTITQTGNNAQFLAGGLIYNNVVLNTGTQGSYLGAAVGPTFNNLTVNGSANNTGGLAISGPSTVTVLGTFTVNGNSPTNFAPVYGYTGNMATICCVNPPSLTNVKFTQVTLAGPANLYPNPSFEDDTLGFGGTGCTLARSTAQSLDGTACLQITATGSAAASLYRNVSPTWDMRAVVPGQTYTFSCYVKPATNAQSWQIRVNWYNAAGGGLGAATGVGYTAETVGQWVRLTCTGTAPANAERCLMQIVSQATPPNGEVHYTDCWQMTQTAAPVAYTVPQFTGTNLLDGGGNSGIAFSWFLAPTAGASSSASAVVSVPVPLTASAGASAKATSVCVPVLGPISTLTDTFNDLSKWTTASGTPSVANGELVLGPVTNPGTQEIYSTNWYRLTGSAVYARVAAAPTYDTPFLQFAVLTATNYWIRWYIAYDPADWPGWSAAQIHVITPQQTYLLNKNSPVNFPISAIAPDNGIWLRIRESAGTIYFDYSTDGLTWTPAAYPSWAEPAVPLALDAVRVDFSTQGDPPGPYPTPYAYVQNLNVPPGPAAITATAQAAAQATATLIAVAVQALVPAAQAQAQAVAIVTAASKLVPAAQAQAQAVAIVTAASKLAPAAQAQAQATAAATAALPLTATAAAQAQATAAASASSRLAASASAQSQAVALLAAPPLLAPTAAASTQATAVLTAPARLSASSTAQTAAIGTVLALAPTSMFPSAGIATQALATVTASALLAPTSTAQTQATALVTANTVPMLSPAAAGRSQATATATVAGRLLPTAASRTAALVTLTVPSVAFLTATARATTRASVLVGLPVPFIDLPTYLAVQSSPTRPLALRSEPRRLAIASGPATTLTLAAVGALTIEAKPSALAIRPESKALAVELETEKVFIDG